MFTCTKQFQNFPFAHRQHTHDGHCALIHGHNWHFEFEFECAQLSRDKFVVDFGKLKWLRQWLEENFDHTLVLNQDDPSLSYLREKLGPVEARQGQYGSLQLTPFAKIIVVPNCGAEGLAQWIFDKVNAMLAGTADTMDRGVRVFRVTVFEDNKNSATYRA